MTKLPKVVNPPAPERMEERELNRLLVGDKKLVGAWTRAQAGDPLHVKQVQEMLTWMLEEKTKSGVQWWLTDLARSLLLTEIVGNQVIKKNYPALWQAAVQVATPHLRNMGTLGGNICLDTRCTYYDQNYEWRRAIDFCMKKDGETCWVAPSSKRCLAVSSTDTAPALMALGASVRLVSTDGERTVSLDDLYANDGIHYITRKPNEILTKVELDDLSDRVGMLGLDQCDRSLGFAAVSAAHQDAGTPICKDLGGLESQPGVRPRNEEGLAGLVGYVSGGEVRNHAVLLRCRASAGGPPERRC